MALTKWREALQLPVIADEINTNWDLETLEIILEGAISSCAAECYTANKGRIVTTLSGGLDSSLCLAIIRKMVGSKVPITTFTIAGSTEHPDFIYAKRMADRYGTTHITWVPTRKKISDAEAQMHSLWPDSPIEEGDAAVFLVCENIASHDFKKFIAHDMIDELFGGYWKHRLQQSLADKAGTFRYFWDRLKDHHLLPLERKAQHFGIEVLLPYGQEHVIKYGSQIPLDDRTSLEMSKTPLRKIAGSYLSAEIIERKKFGFCDALNLQ